MCKKEQHFNITEALILNTFELQVQPFGVTNDKFSTGKIWPLIKSIEILVQIVIVHRHPILVKFCACL